MKLKLFDFGLMTCVKKASLSSTVYELTGCTGSLRYMAPEVASHKPYNEKVDVHSFGIILWEMVTGKLPFKGVTKLEFMSEVVGKGFRPKIPKDASPQLSLLMKQCWDSNAMLRPTCSEILTALTAIQTASEAADGKGANKSSWF